MQNLLNKFRNWVADRLGRYSATDMAREKAKNEWSLRARREILSNRCAIQAQISAHQAVKSARLAHVEAEKVKILGHSKKIDEKPGYIYIEVPELVKWLVQGNAGALQLLQNAVSSAAQAQLLEVIGYAV